MFFRKFFKKKTEDNLSDIGKKSRFKKCLLILLVLTLLGASFWSGLVAGYSSKFYGSNADLPKIIINKDFIPANLSGEVDFGLFWQLWDLLKKDYYKQPVAETKLFYGAMMGMVAALEDPHSIFLDPDVNKKFAQELEGSYEGIGAEIGNRSGRLTIIAPLPNTPAERAGLRAGDKVMAIDGADTTGMALDLAVSLIRGEKKTAVVLTVMRKGEEKPQEMSIIRDEIAIESVTWEIKEGGIAYIQLSYFNEDATSEFKKAVMKVLKQSPKGLILDLRNNPGGFLNVAVDITGFWIENNVAVIEKFRGGEEEQYKTSNGALLGGIKTVVLINGGSASASEILAGALQDYGKATLVGEKTFGKGTVQQMQSLPDGSAVKLTVAEWLTPERKSIEENGIAPDVEVEYSDEDFENNRDPQLDKAMELLNQ